MGTKHVYENLIAGALGVKDIFEAMSSDVLRLPALTQSASIKVNSWLPLRPPWTSVESGQVEDQLAGVPTSFREMVPSDARRSLHAEAERPTGQF